MKKLLNYTSMFVQQYDSELMRPRTRSRAESNTLNDKLYVHACPTFPVQNQVPQAVGVS